MLDPENNEELPPIPGKRYFTIGEVSKLCGVRPHILRYWEPEFSQLNPIKRRGNRRCYRREDVLILRQIRFLLYDKGLTIEGARRNLIDSEKMIDFSQCRQIVKQSRLELEQILDMLCE